MSRSGKRKYSQRRRAVSTAETRRRIVEAAVSLHSSVGPSRTSFTSVAKRARVSRPTLYRHFPDLPSLFAACMSHGESADPMPDPSAWTKVRAPRERLLLALTDLYAYYRRNQAINLHMRRDSELASLLERLGGAYLGSVGPNPEPRVLRLLAKMRPMMEARDGALLETLVAPWRHAELANPELRAALAVVVRYDTWKTLTQDHGLNDEDAARVAAAMAVSAAG
jgi:AcrR family transcriptional regulator